MCLLGKIGGGAISSRQVMAVLSSQGRGEAGTLPSVVNDGTAVRRECNLQFKTNKTTDTVKRSKDVNMGRTPSVDAGVSYVIWVRDKL